MEASPGCLLVLCSKCTLIHSTVFRDKDRQLMVCINCDRYVKNYVHLGFKQFTHDS